MKRRHLLLVALSLIISICMCLSLAGCGKKKAAPQLDAPVVTVNNDTGVAQWKAVENASGYAYKLDNGDEIATDNTSVTLTEGQSIVVKAVGDGKNYSDSVWSQAKTYIKPSPSSPKTLSTPIVNISIDGVASWSKIAGALSYVYKINDGAEQETTALSVQLREGDSIVVKAVGDGGTTSYDSGWSEVKVYDSSSFATPLAKPVVNVSPSGLAEWKPVPHANSYAYIINSSSQKITNDTSVQLENVGDTIKVQALGDGVNYTPSAWSDVATYIGSEPTDPDTLKTPKIEIDDDGIVTWEPITNADYYVFLKNDTIEGQTSSTRIEDLVPGDRVKVKAVSDNEKYGESEWSNEVEYKATETKPGTLAIPSVSVAIDGTASWAEVPHASGYIVKLNDVAQDQTSSLSVKLSNNQKIEVMAVGNGTTYLSSEYSQAITYKAPASTLSAPANIVIKVEGTTAGTVLVSWDEVTGATGYKYIVGTDNPVEVDGHSNIELTLAEGQAIKVMAVGVYDIETAGDYSACIEDSEYSAPETFTIDNTITYSVSEIIPIAVYYGTTASTKDFTVSGVVSANEAYSTQFKNIGITLKEGDLTFVLFGSKFANGGGYTLAADELKGFTVSATGKVLYHEGTTPEFGVNNVVTVTDGDSDARMALAVREMSLDEVYYSDFDLPVAGFGVNVTNWTVEIADTANSDALAAAKVDDVWKATVVRKSVDVEVKLTAHLSVGGKTQDVNLTTTVKAEKTLVAIPSKLAASLSFETTNNRNSFDATSKIQVWKQNNITFTNSGGSSMGDYCKPVRCYQGSSIKVEYADMVKIVFNCNSASYATELKNSINEKEYLVSVDGTVVTVELCGKSNSFVITELVKQVRIDSIDVYVAEEPDPLGVPVVGNIDLYGNVTWSTVENAKGYEYCIVVGGVDGKPVPVTAPVTVKLEDGQAIKVRAVGDGLNYAAYSEWSEAKTYTKQEQHLDTLPAIEIDEASGDVILKAPVEHATGFVYQIKDNDGDWKTAVEIDVKSINSYPYVVINLKDGQSIRIQAVGDEIYIFDAEKWTEDKYTEPEGPVTLGAPKVEVDRNGKVTWSHTNSHVTQFKYYIGVDLTKDDLNGVEWLTPNGDVVLESGKSIAVIACHYDDMTLDSAATIVTYTEPDKHDPVDLGDVSFAAGADKDGKKQVIISWSYDVADVTFEIVLTDESGDDTLTTQAKQIEVELKDYTAIVIRVAQTNGTPAAPDFDYRNFKNASDSISILEKYNTYYDGIKVANALAKLPDITGTYKADFEVQTSVDGLLVAWTVKVESGDGNITIEGNTAKVTQSKTGETVVTVTASITCGKVTEKREFTVTIAKAVNPYDPVTASVNIADYATKNGWNSNNQNKKLSIDDFITVTVDGSPNTGKYYSDWRIYQSENPTITVTVKTGYTIISVKFTYSVDKTGVLTSADKATNYPSDTKIDVNADTISFTVGNTASVTNGQVRITAIEVVYKKLPTQLAAPQLEYADGNVTWQEITGASSYKYTIDNSEVQTIEVGTTLSIPLEDGQTIRVWAVGNNREYSDSEVAVISRLTVPEISKDKLGNISLTKKVENATKYVYQIKDKDSETWIHGGEVIASAISAYPYVITKLDDGQSIKVMAVSDEADIVDSSYCEPETYIYTADPDDLAVPTITVDIDGKVSVFCANATGYKYKLNDGGETAWTGSLKLNDGDRISMQALGDTDHKLYNDSEWSDTITYKAPLTYNAPEVDSFKFDADQSNDGNILITWKSVADNAKYTVIVDGQSFPVDSAEYSAEFKKVGYIAVKVNGTENQTVPNGIADYSVIIRESSEVEITTEFNDYYEKNKPDLPEEILVFSEMGYENQQKVSNVEGEYVTLDFTDGSTATAYYSTSSSGNTPGIRVYPNATLTISTETKTIEKIEIKLGKLGPAISVNSGKFTTEPAANSTAVWEGSAQKVVFTFAGSGNTQLASIKVIYKIPLTEQQKVDKVAKELTIDEPLTDEEMYMYGLPSTDELYDTEITWSTVSGLISDNGDELEEDGTLTVYRREGEVAVVVVKATIKLGDAEAVSIHTLIIPALAEEGEDDTSVSWKKVTPDDELKAGDIIILTYLDGSVAMGSYTSEGFRDKVDITVSSGKPDLSSSRIAVITLIASGDDDSHFALKIAGKYMSTNPSGTDNAFNEEDDISDNGKWQFTINESGVATIAAAAGSKAYLYYDAENSRFSCFNSANASNITVYKLIKGGEEGGDEPTPPPTAKEWKKVKDISQINGILSGAVEELSIVITAYADNDADTLALGEYANKNNIPAVDFNKDNIPESIKLKLVKGGKDKNNDDTNTYAILQGNNYLYAAGASSNNYLKTKATADSNCYCTISVTSEGVATVIFQGSASRNTMQYNPNNGSPMFSCYSSASQQEISIWVYA